MKNVRRVALVLIILFANIHSFSQKTYEFEDDVYYAITYSFYPRFNDTAELQPSRALGYVYKIADTIIIRSILEKTTGSFEPLMMHFTIKTSYQEKYPSTPNTSEHVYVCELTGKGIIYHISRAGYLTGDDKTVAVVVSEVSKFFEVVYFFNY